MRQVIVNVNEHNVIISGKVIVSDESTPSYKLQEGDIDLTGKYDGDIDSIKGKYFDPLTFTFLDIETSPIIKVSCVSSVDSIHPLMNGTVPVNENELYIKEGDSIIADISVSDFLGNPIDLSGNAFSMPIIDATGNERIVLVMFDGPSNQIIIPFNKSGVYTVTKEMINRDLPIGVPPFIFSGIKVFVYEDTKSTMTI